MDFLSARPPFFVLADELVLAVKSWLVKGTCSRKLLGSCETTEI